MWGSNKKKPMMTRELGLKDAKANGANESFKIAKTYTPGDKRGFTKK